MLWPLVVGPYSIPVITDEQMARQAPELAVLSAMAHGEKPMAHLIARAALAAAQRLDEARARLYVEMVESSLNNAARAALKKLMQSGEYEYQSDFARKYYAQGFEEGLQQAREERRQQRLEKEFKDGWVISILEVLDGRGVALDAEARQRIQACADLAQLKIWLRRALTVRNAEELFSE